MVSVFIPLRSGSKSITDKNIKLFNGKPLCYWVLKACQYSKLIDEIIVAIDSKKYENIISDFKFDKIKFYNRKPINSKDMSSSESVILEYLSTDNLPLNSIFLLVQATSPHLNSNELDEMILKSQSENTDVVSCVRLKRFIWGENGVPLNYNISQRPRRQEFEGLLVENGAVYISRVNKIIDSNCRVSGRISLYEMNENSFFEIDEDQDFLISELLMKGF